MIYFFIIIITIIILIPTAYASFFGAPWVPTRKREVDRFLKLAEIKPGDLVYDLGSGDGRLVIAAAEKCQAKAIGLEISPFPYFLSKLKIFLRKTKNCQIKYKNLFKENLSPADVVFIFLLPRPYARLKKKLEQELKPGAKVITECWPIQGWQFLKRDKPDDQSMTLYLYVKN